jgi:23S rRNA (adenine2503-C2)-methyltransferase
MRALPMTPTHLRNLSLDHLRERISAAGEPEYRFRQVAAWIYSRLEDRIDAMTDLPRELRDGLAASSTVRSIQTATVQESEIDATRKYLFELADGARVESVLMRYETRNTLCVSSQVGCPLDCIFCETARGQYQRNLSAGEILDQICLLKRDAGPPARKVNIVFMGMGEPLLNLDAVVGAIQTLNHPLGLDHGERRITVSTSSFPDRIRALADSGAACSLALSLNAPNDEKRKHLMPKASRFSIEELLDAARYFAGSGQRRVTLEYVLIPGMTMGDDDADQLGRLVRGQPFKVNLIPYNPGRVDPFARPTEPEIDHFASRLLPLAAAVTVRRSRGVDIDAACGQLWNLSLSRKPKPVEDAA